MSGRFHPMERRRCLRIEPLEDRSLLAVSAIGTVWADADGNGLRGANETPIEGAVIRVFEGGAYRGGGVSNSGGQYNIGQLLPNVSYRMVVTPPVNTRLTVPNAGDDARDSDFDPSNWTVNFTVPTGHNEVVFDAGLIAVNEQFPLTLGNREILLGAGQLGLNYFPDMSIPVIARGQNLRMYTAAGHRSYLLQGPDIQNLNSATLVLAEGGVGSYDNGGAWICGHHQAGNNLYVFYHAEDQENMPPIPGGIPGFYASIAAAVSTDGGLTFTKLGRVLTSSLPKDTNGRPAQGAGECSVVAGPTGRYLYMYYTDHSNLNGRGVQIAMARADLSQGPPTAGSWEKYYQGSFSQPGLGGFETPIVTAPGGAGDAINPQVTYSVHLKRYVMTYGVNDWTEYYKSFAADSGVYLAYSADGIHWSGHTNILPDWSIPLQSRRIATHPSIIWDTGNGALGSGWLVYGYSPSWGSGNGQTPHHMAGQRITFDPVVADPIDPELLAYDGFQYAPGDLFGAYGAGSFGFDNIWTRQFGDSSTAAGSLAYGNLLTEGNRGQQLPANHGRIRRRLDTDPEGRFAAHLEDRVVTEVGFGNVKPLIGKDGTELYVSFLQKALDHFGFYALEIQRADFAPQEGDGNRVAFVGYNGAELVLESDFNGSTRQSLGALHNNVNMYVLKFTFGSGNNDTLQVYRNPSLGGQPQQPTATIHGDFAFDRISFAKVNGPNNRHEIDEIRVGTTYRAVTGDSIGDYGDAPASFPVTYANNGARHLAFGPTLGFARDAESDGQPSANADGDGTDEDGVMFGNIAVGAPLAAVNISLGNAATARADAWIDFDGDGIWQADEKILDSVQVFDGGFRTYNFTVNADAVAGETFARVRVSSGGNLGFTGWASDGEVEDYRVSIVEPPTVESLSINGGDSQRSSLTEVVVTFDGEVTAPASAFQIKQRGTDQILDTLLVNSSINPLGKTVSVLTFGDNGNLVINRPNGGNSLVDGNYQLTIDHTQVSAVGGGPNMLGDYVIGDQAADNFFRFFSDQDGDRDADTSDLVGFGGTFRKNSFDPGFNPLFDADGDNDVDTNDLIQFGQRFRGSLPF